MDVFHHNFREDDAYNRDCAAFKVNCTVLLIVLRDHFFTTEVDIITCSLKLVFFNPGRPFSCLSSWVVCHLFQRAHVSPDYAA